MGVEDAAEVRAVESASDGVDVWSDAVESHAPDHLLVMVHGILGRYATNAVSHLSCFRKEGFYDYLLNGLGKDVMLTKRQSPGFPSPSVLRNGEPF
jgi:hypothetical protein